MEQTAAPCDVSDFLAVMPYVDDNTHCELQMFWQQILQLGDAFVDSVASFLFDQSVWQLVRLLERIETVFCCFFKLNTCEGVGKRADIQLEFTLLSSPRFMPLLGLYI